MSWPTSRRPVPRVGLCAAILCLLGAGCVVEEPLGPATVLVTVYPWPAGAGSTVDELAAAFAADASAAPPAVRAVEFDFDRSSPWLAGATLIAQCDAADVDAAARFVPGARDTIFERLSREEFECGAFLSGALFDETQGLLQGHLLHDEFWLREAAGVDAGPLGAAHAGGQYVELRLLRALEDTPCAWVHLDLSDAELARDLAPAADGAAALRAALARLAAATSADPAAVVALVDLDGRAGGPPIAVRARGAAVPPPPVAAAFGSHLRAVMAGSEQAVEAP